MSRASRLMWPLCSISCRGLPCARSRSAFAAATRACSLSPLRAISAKVASAIGLYCAAAAFTSAVILFGVPFWRPPRRSPGFDPAGICYPVLFLPRKSPARFLGRAHFASRISEGLPRFAGRVKGVGTY